MTTPYAISTHIGSQSYSSNLNTTITGPLNTNQTPCQIPYHSYGVLAGIRPTPPQFYPMQEPVYTNMNVNARHQYKRTSVSTADLQKQIALGKASKPQHFVSYSTQKQIPISSHTNYISPIDSSLRTNTLKANTVGQSAYKVNLPNAVPTGTKSYYPSGTRSSLRRARSGGCTAPKKKGSIYNTCLSNGQVCAWGSLPRQNY